MWKVFCNFAITHCFRKDKKMKTLTIHHIGPIKHVTLRLKRINVILVLRVQGKVVF